METQCPSNQVDNGLGHCIPCLHCKKLTSPPDTCSQCKTMGIECIAGKVDNGLGICMPCSHCKKLEKPPKSCLKCKFPTTTRKAIKARVTSTSHGTTPTTTGYRSTEQNTHLQPKPELQWQPTLQSNAVPALQESSTVAGMVGTSSVAPSVALVANQISPVLIAVVAVSAVIAIVAMYIMLRCFCQKANADDTDKKDCVPVDLVSKFDLTKRRAKSEVVSRDGEGTLKLPDIVIHSNKSDAEESHKSHNGVESKESQVVGMAAQMDGRSEGMKCTCAARECTRCDRLVTSPVHPGAGGALVLPRSSYHEPDNAN
ncbi:uncharacterized protein LOC100367776 [Saccoglossus kowalevskii]|uniref:Uncharacterized protein LOC100367776 n=1 Tax=Saccoglossus kowalevskii TaxID=10224 RepID=A0ABM0GVB9_SACKO|nr:PREDICTED: uncharacterized protein LOC100367776 [Saccoglossus kowalevskii]